MSPSANRWRSPSKICARRLPYLFGVVCSCTAVESGGEESSIFFEGVEYPGADTDFVDDDVFDFELVGDGDDSTGGVYEV